MGVVFHIFPIFGVNSPLLLFGTAGIEDACFCCFVSNFPMDFLLSRKNKKILGRCAGLLHRCVVNLRLKKGFSP